MKIFALTLLLTISCTNSFINIQEEKLKEVFKMSERDILINIQEVLGNIKEENTKVTEESKKEIQNIKEEVAKLSDENKAMRNDVSQLLELAEKTADSPANRGFVKGGWTPANKRTLTFDEGAKFCHYQNAKIYHPSNSEDYKFLQNFLISTSEYEYLWFPISDRVTEGQFTWDNGAALTKTDEEEIPWRSSQLYNHNAAGRDCGIIHQNGKVHITGCAHEIYAGVMCSF